MGALGRKTYDRAGWSPRLLMFQRAIFVVCFGGIVGWMLFVILQVGSESA